MIHHYMFSTTQKNTVRNYEPLLDRLCGQLGDRELASLTTDEILSFLNQFSEGTKPSTKRLRYSLLSAFFNILRTQLTPLFTILAILLILRKIFRVPRPNNGN